MLNIRTLAIAAATVSLALTAAGPASAQPVGGKPGQCSIYHQDKDGTQHWDWFDENTTMTDENGVKWTCQNGTWVHPNRTAQPTSTGTSGGTFGTSGAYYGATTSTSGMTGSTSGTYAQP